MRQARTPGRLRNDHSFFMHAVFVLSGLATPMWAVAGRAEPVPEPMDLATCVTPVHVDGASCEDPVPLAAAVIPAPAATLPTDALALSGAPAPAPQPTPAEVKAENAGVAIGTGQASFYGHGDGFAGKKTANGETFRPAELTAAHRTLPFGTKLKVTDTATGHAVVVRVNDRGPYAKGRVLDLSYGAAQQLGIVSRGHAQVKLERL